MDLAKQFKEHQEKVNRKFSQIDAKLSFMQESLKGVRSDLEEIQSEINDFMQFSSEYIVDHENRIKALEAKVNP